MTAAAAPLPGDRVPAGTPPGPPAGPRSQNAAQGAIPAWLLTALTPDPERLARGRAEAVRVRAAELAAGRPWPPPTDHTYGLPQTAPRPLVVRGSAVSDDCARGADHVPCVPAPGGRWPCPWCGTVTVVAGPVGPRLPWCDCRGDAPVCVHPRPAWVGRG